jgi:hypothetical protein
MDRDDESVAGPGALFGGMNPWRERGKKRRSNLRTKKQWRGQEHYLVKER